MYYVCRHIMPNGSRCNSPALRGKPYCYFHDRLHRQQHAQDAPDGDAPLKFPVLEDRSAIQVALTQVFNAVGASKLDPRRAGLFLYGLQIASQNVDRRYDILQITAVQSVTETPEGDELAPKSFKCFSPDDCSQCPEKDNCEDFDPDGHGDDDEDDEDE